MQGLVVQRKEIRGSKWLIVQWREIRGVYVADCSMEGDWRVQVHNICVKLLRQSDEWRGK